MEKSKEKNVLKADRIELTDSNGKTRIALDGGGEEGCASICLFSPNGKSVQIRSQPSGEITIHVFGQRCSNICIGLSGDDRGSIFISDVSGGLGTVLGEEPETGTHRLLLFKDGQHFWKTPSGMKKPNQPEVGNGENVSGDERSS